MRPTRHRHGARDTEFSTWASDAQHLLFRKAYLLTGERENARDLVQQVLLSTYLAWIRVDNPTAYATTSLLRASFKVTDRRRREVLSDDIEGPSTPPPGSDDTVTLMEVLAELPPRMRAVVVLRFWDDLSVRETANVLGCSEGTVKSSSSRALTHLRTRLGEDIRIDRPSPTPKGAIR